MINRETVIVSLKLFIITAAAALCLAAVNLLTAPVIAENSEKATAASQQEVLPDAKTFQKTEFSEKDIPVGTEGGVKIESANVGLDGEKGVGYVITAISNAGYGGDIKVMIGINAEGRVTRVKILESAETPGLGANASKPDFINQYNGKSGSLAVIKGDTKAESEISAISGATVTSKAVTSCVNAALELVKTKSDKGMDADTTAKINEKVEETKKETYKQMSEEEAKE